MLIITLIQLFGGDSGYYGYGRFGAGGGAGTELGTILIILLIVYMLGGFRQVLGGAEKIRSGDVRRSAPSSGANAASDP